ncbi:VOC family protein [Nonomuraea sp. B12E4]|uniref:VOC family protein n=1 Tax=Nonomuraea sp. B12E4 TaxID=3153564 RepID=UPI00325C5A4A
MEITHLQKPPVPVTGQDAAKAFYVDKLGFELRGDAPVPMGESSRWVEVAPKGARTALILCDRMPDAPKLRGVMFETRDTGETVAALRDAGGEARPERVDG